MEDYNPVKETFLIGSFKVALPTVDVYSDVALTTKLYVYGQAKWASLLLGPFLFNYVLSWYAWFTYEKRKKTTLIAALVGFYSQFVLFFRTSKFPLMLLFRVPLFTGRVTKKKVCKNLGIGRRYINNLKNS